MERPLLEAWTGLSRRDLGVELITPSGNLNGRQAAALVLQPDGEGPSAIRALVHLPCGISLLETMAMSACDRATGRWKNTRTAG